MRATSDRTLSPAEFAREFDDGRLFKRSAWRYEQLDWYTSPATEQRVALFLAGEKVTAAEREPWLAMLRRNRDAGITIGRVHLIAKPLSDYLRYELACYESSAAAGEDIRILPAEDAAGLDLPDFDYYLFDETVPGKAWVAVQLYGDRGAWLGADVITDPGFVADCRRWRHAATSKAIPLDAYMKERSAA
jgi:hypothetical protein